MWWTFLGMWACGPSPTGPDGEPDPPPVDAPVWSFKATDRPNTQQLVLVLPSAAAVEVVCGATGDPDEVLEAIAPEPSRWHELSIHGLLADTDYDCDWTAGPWRGDGSIRTDPLPDWVPAWSVEGTPGWGEWTLFSTGRTEGARKQQILVVDGRGRVRWAYRLPKGDVPDVDASYLGNGEVLYGGGYGINPAVVDLDQVLVSRADKSSTGRDFHHHAERLEGGEVLTMSLNTHVSDDGSYDWTGFTIELHDPTLTGIPWSWSSMTGVADGWLPVPDEEHNDPYHPNSVQRIGDAVYINQRGQHSITKLDMDSGLPVWSLGVRGDFTLLDAAGTPLTNSGAWFFGAHAPEITGDRVLLYDNGWTRPGDASSRVMELQLDEVAMTATVLWEWAETGWYEPIWGDADRLPDGGVLVTRGHCTGLAGCRDDLRTEIIELGPGDPGDVVWRLTMGDAADGGYRAERLDRCDLLRHRGVCPEGWP